jgi:hypothetical protein
MMPIMLLETKLIYIAKWGLYTHPTNKIEPKHQSFHIRICHTFNFSILFWIFTLGIIHPRYFMQIPKFLKINQRETITGGYREVFYTKPWLVYLFSHQHNNMHILCHFPPNIFWYNTIILQITLPLTPFFFTLKTLIHFWMLTNYKLWSE